jgi:uncharacterized RDD family membrane protein YckC
MNKKNIYTAIAVVFGVCYAYNLFWFFKSFMNFFNYGFDFFFIGRYIPIFMGVAGVVIFIQSKFKRSNLLRIIMCMEVMSAPFIIFWYIQFFTTSYGPFNTPPELNWTFYVGCVMNISLVLSSVVGLRLLSLNKTATLTYIESGGEPVAQFSPAPAGKRFANRLVDLLLIYYIILVNQNSYSNIFKESGDLGPAFVLVLEIPFFLFYYLIMEGIFNTTAGKCATNTTIVNESGERPRFTQILGRTFSRIIPFEPFSFLGAAARGWHDTLTNTYVVDCINNEDQVLDEFILDAELENQPS